MGVGKGKVLLRGLLGKDAGRMWQVKSGLCWLGSQVHLSATVLMMVMADT